MLNAAAVRPLPSSFCFSFFIFLFPFLFLLSTSHSQSHIHTQRLTIIYSQSQRSTIIYSLIIINPHQDLHEHINNHKNIKNIQEREEQLAPVPRGASSSLRQEARPVARPRAGLALYPSISSLARPEPGGLSPARCCLMDGPDTDFCGPEEKTSQKRAGSARLEFWLKSPLGPRGGSTVCHSTNWSGGGVIKGTYNGRLQAVCEPAFLPKGPPLS
jgi:hypothetical protein